MAKIAVIGAGIGGMSAAARLAKFGHKVTVYENSDRSGGKCRTEWFGDYAFDTGPSLLTLPAVYRDLFLKTGKRIEHILNLEPVDPAFNYFFPDGMNLTFPNLSNPKTYLEIENKLGKNASKGWQQIIERAERMWDVSREQFVESELNSFWQLLNNRNLISQIREISPFTSLRKLSNQVNLDPHLRMIVDRYATYTGSDPRTAPAVHAARRPRSRRLRPPARAAAGQLARPGLHLQCAPLPERLGRVPRAGVRGFDRRRRHRGFSGGGSAHVQDARQRRPRRNRETP